MLKVRALVPSRTISWHVMTLCAASRVQWEEEQESVVMFKKYTVTHCLKSETRCIQNTRLGLAFLSVLNHPIDSLQNNYNNHKEHPAAMDQYAYSTGEVHRQVADRTQIG